MPCIQFVLYPFLLGGLPSLASKMSRVFKAERDTLPQTLRHDTVRVIRHSLIVVPGARSVPSKNKSIRSVLMCFHNLRRANTDVEP